MYEIEVGTTAGLQAIHHALFAGLYPFAGEILKLNMTVHTITKATSLNIKTLR